MSRSGERGSFDSALPIAWNVPIEAADLALEYSPDV